MSRLSRGAERGAGLIDVLIAIVVIGTCIVGLAGQVLTVRNGGRRAALEGRRAELAQRLADRVRSGLATAESGDVSALVGGEAFRASYARREDVAPGAIEFSAGTAADPGALVLGPAQPVP